ncbi:imidazolonepropionase [Peredibacter starrii]|uniref:Imidazolonepropionase n=1 Tax=Peredibacter starrii TaxID=28202 RepID=A0AAX4HPX8_9BACT|nr:imidazolonepropionase [Peredibacter starrii]WPU65369.1 imidazolonepropionase [Peredibacter starrii]
MKTYVHLNQLVTLEGALKKDGRRLVPADLSIIEDGAIVFDDERIVWTGKSSELPAEYQKNSIDMKGHVLTPEMVDSHTHIVFGGDRAQEYADRLNGVSYEEIAKRGGGILLTMTQTNKATTEELFNSACARIERLHSYGIGTIEIKSGYGLNFEKEYEVSLVIDRLKKKYQPKIQIFNTYLAAHDVPRTFSSSSQYLKEVVLPLLEKLAPMKVIDAVDIFHEKNYFTAEDTDLLFSRAKQLGIARKIHADELNDNDGAKLAVKHEALSADHLLKISASGIAALANSKTVATLLPGTAFFLGKPLAPARTILDGGAKVSIASDYNPGSCHCDNLLLIASIASAQMKLNQAELWTGITLNAAAALALPNQGALLPGMRPRFSIFKTESLSHITYNWGKNFAVTTL